MATAVKMKKMCSGVHGFEAFIFIHLIFLYNIITYTVQRLDIYLLSYSLKFVSQIIQFLIQL